ncbi:MAG: hypothetical protein ACI9WU_003746 [Myxococcota bacterium]|jgi:hypothetical protein
MRWLVLSMCLTMMPLGASATQVVALDLDQMTDRADVIIMGKVTSVVAERPTEARGRIHTLVTVQASEVLRADKQAATYTFSVPGGVVGKIGQLVPGAPRFVVGQEVLVLMSRHQGTQRLRVVGLSQGRYEVQRTAGQSAEIVSDRAGIGLVLRDPQGRITDAPASHSVDRHLLVAALERIRARVRTR